MKSLLIALSVVAGAAQITHAGEMTEARTFRWVCVPKPLPQVRPDRDPVTGIKSLSSSPRSAPGYGSQSSFGLPIHPARRDSELLHKFSDPNFNEMVTEATCVTDDVQSELPLTDDQPQTAPSLSLIPGATPLGPSGSTPYSMGPAQTN
jgi:hypothetical protein